MASFKDTRTKWLLKNLPPRATRKFFNACGAPGGFADRRREHRRIVWDHNQMSMIRHQTPSQNPDAKSVQLLRHEIEVGSSIAFSLENRNGSHAPLGDVMRITGRHNP